MNNLLLTGAPGVGKTTAIIRALEQANCSARGFFTREQRGPHGRTGFAIETFEGRVGTLASVNLPGPPRVGKYGVNVRDLEDIGVSEIESSLLQGQLVVIDEIGKMELFSERFRDVVLRALEATSPVLGTITRYSHPFADRIKVRKDVRVIELTPRNRERIVEETLVPWLRGWGRSREVHFCKKL